MSGHCHRSGLEQLVREQVECSRAEAVHLVDEEQHLASGIVAEALDVAPDRQRDGTGRRRVRIVAWRTATLELTTHVDWQFAVAMQQRVDHVRLRLVEPEQGARLD